MDLKKLSCDDPVAMNSYPSGGKDIMCPYDSGNFHAGSRNTFLETLKGSA
jgi:hypothetical protein